MEYLRFKKSKKGGGNQETTWWSNTVCELCVVWRPINHINLTNMQERITDHLFSVLQWRHSPAKDPVKTNQNKLIKDQKTARFLHFKVNDYQASRLARQCLVGKKMWEINKAVTYFEALKWLLQHKQTLLLLHWNFPLNQSSSNFLLTASLSNEVPVACF